MRLQAIFLVLPLQTDKVETCTYIKVETKVWGSWALTIQVTTASPGRIATFSSHPFKSVALSLMWPGANNEAVRTCRYHTVLARPNHLDLGRLCHQHLFVQKQPTQLVSQNITNQIIVFERVLYRLNMFVEIDIHIRAALFNQVGLVASALSVSSFAN